MNSLKQYAKYYKRMIAYSALCDDLKNLVLRELKRCEDGRARVDEVEFHLTKYVRREYPKDIRAIIEDLRAKIKLEQELAEQAGKVKFRETETFDASIPKSMQEDVLAQVSDYAKHFGIK